MRRFAIGDYVTVCETGAHFGAGKGIDGLTGRVVAYGSCDTSFGIEFDRDIDGHDCRGNARHGHGWYIFGSQLRKAYSNIR